MFHPTLPFIFKQKKNSAKKLPKNNLNRAKKQTNKQKNPEKEANNNQNNILKCKHSIISLALP